VLDGTAAHIIAEHLDDKAPAVASAPAATFSPSTFERGPDMIFQDNSISRAHAMLFYDNEGCGIIDLASTNGTLVNEAAVSSAIIKSGDSISIGNTTLSVDLT
jgi:pSer/pThr/pTyr-binding forkhead associated (FHA) protein